MASSSHSVLASSSRYDVFLSFRGEDVRKTYVDHLYSALLQQGIHTYKDDQTLPRGGSICPSLLKAIEESKISVIVFSENYADSSWCLDELVHIMKCRDERGIIVYPIFYDLKPLDVRKHKTKYGEAFGKVENNAKVESWRKALSDASNVAGWEPKKMANGHESMGIKEIVNAISEKLFSLVPHADEKLVGMGTRLYSLKSKLKFCSGGVQMVGIWGMGGSGKTTLASSLYAEISDQFDGHCIIDSVREESSKYGLKRLQGKLLSKVLRTNVEADSVEEGKDKIKDRLCGRKVLILLDDVDDVEQLEALAGSHEWFGDGSRIIITTRDEHLLKTHKVDTISPVSLLSQDEAIQLFKKHAYDKDRPVEDYETLSLHVVSYAAGLPLALKLLGSFLYDKDNDEWMSTLARLEDIPDSKIVEKLKISYDGLGPLEKELFLDIACFHRRRLTVVAIPMLDACGFHPGIGVKVLMQKALITIQHGMFDMHDLVQEMGHYIVRGEHPYNPEKHSRVWETKKFNNMCLGVATMANDKTEALIYDGYSSHFPELLSSMNKLRLLHVSHFYGDSDGEVLLEAPKFLSNELRYIQLDGHLSLPLSENFHPMKLVDLRFSRGLQKELWIGYKLLPQLKNLHIYRMKNLHSTPDFDGLPFLQRLTLTHCPKVEEIHPSLGNHTRLVYLLVRNCDELRKFPAIFRMKKLSKLDISCCEAFREFPEIKANMDRLVDLSLRNVGIQVLPSSIGEYCTNLTSLILERCEDLKSMEVNFHALKYLCKFQFSFKTQLQKLPKDLFDENCCLEELSFHKMGRAVLPMGFPRLPRFLKKLAFTTCKLKDGEIPSDIVQLSNLQELDLSGNDFSRLDFCLSQLTLLKLLNLTNCENLVELPELPSSMVTLKADNCKSLEVVGEFHKNCKRLSQVSLTNVRSVIGGDRLLQTMLQGEPHSLSLQLDGLEIPKLFKPHPVVGWRRCRLQLPENWYNDFSGFLMCAALRVPYPYFFNPNITMKQEIGGASSIIDHSEDDVVREESTAKVTWVGYVSFASLRNTAWWDLKSSLVSFSMDPFASLPGEAFGVTLVPKKTPIETTYSYHDYKQSFEILRLRDSKYYLEIEVLF